ncbi:probable ARP5 - Actin-related protein [Cephalotrichum gorgonifer]|uniref:Probable ARP5 - Actin-related protein n=1 Tax=Cephalotrichum gorgonifer TaxID=2041049 RepID=A0AAE8N6F4_9PEZI|nr:probable ARP5 - Actin-related protein [Cephalotrichum gorgonifer]
MAPSATADSVFELPESKRPAERTYPPAKIFPVREARFEKPIPVQVDGREKALAQPPGSAAIVIDNGSSTLRAGWSFEDKPRLAIPPIMAKYRDRKAGKTYSFAGSDCYADTTAKSHIRSAFEAGTGIVTSWDAMEHVLDYVFLKMGMNGVDGAIDMPIVMTEAVANLAYSRKTMTEIIFECYGAPSLAYGIDSLFSYNYNGGKTGLVVSSSNSATHVIPVYNSKAMLAQATRLSWGGYQGAEYLLRLIRLKYPSFSGKLNVSQAEYMLRDFGYVSTDYNNELRSYLDWTGLEDRDIVIQYQYTEEVVVQKSQEELDKAAQKKRENGLRLQRQAAKMRLEKLMQKEKRLDQFKKIQEKLPELNKKETKRVLDDNELKDEAALDKIVKELEKAVRKGRMKDVGIEEEEEATIPSFELLDIPDEELDEVGLKNKKQQRLAKANYEARQRAKAEKEAEKERIAEEKRKDDDRRKNDLENWLIERHEARAETLLKMKEKERLNKDLGNRKSLASQMRMKNIANLASDQPAKKRRRGGDDDMFGANDDDWGVYRDIADNPSDDEEEDLLGKLTSLEQDLLLHDENFRYDDTHEAQSDWSKSLLHAWTRGPRPFDAGSQAELHQIHLNVERIRVPEVIFQPSIAGVDQAGLVEIAGDILNQRLASVPGRDDFLRDIFLTGGNTLFKNFDQRLRDELRALLPAGAPLATRPAQDAILDAWRGAAGWAASSGWKNARVTKAEYEEKGSEYFKEHNLGNAFV